MQDFNEYSELSDSGFEGQTPQEAPEEAFFKSIYIAGKPLQIEGTNIRTIPAHLQIRGLEYNLSKVHFIITNIKRILVNEIKENNKMKNICFSYDLKNGRNNKVCGANSAERSADQFCSTCRSQLVVCGIYCSENGQPIKKDDKYNFIFLRGKATKYSNISEYLNTLYNMDLEPFFEKSKDPEIERKRISFEKSIVNHKRFVTEITVTSIESSYGPVDVFKLKNVITLNDTSVNNILNMSKKIISKFNDKFDWNKNQKSSNYESYAKSTPKPPAEENQFIETEDKENNKPPFEVEKKQEDKKTETESNTPADVSFDDFEF